MRYQEDMAKASELLAGNLTRLRIRAGLSKVRLAQLAGVHENTVRYIEQGKVVNAGLANLEAIAQALGVTLEELLFGEAPTPGELESSWEAFRASRMMPDATEAERDEVLRRGMLRFGPPTPAVWYHAISLLRSGRAS